MRTTCLILMVFASSLFATDVNSQVTKVNIAIKNASIIQIIRAVESQTDYLFVYDKNEIDLTRKIDIVAENKSVAEILSDVFSNTNVVYAMEGNSIILMQKTTLSQQQKPISGKVIDSSGGPLPGVTVVVKGTTQGTITDAEGNYLISNVPSDAILVFSFVGMKTREVPVAGKRSIDVALEEETIGLEEVVAVGYGTMRRKDLTGSVASVSGTTLKDIPVTSAAQAIVGRMPGVQVTKTEGSPDAEIKIRVRGGGSLTQDNSPLYIVDGFPVDNINDIASTDIESIDVLKDASSTAIYGARGANGVILITTKRGFEGKGKVNYNTYFGVKEITQTLDVLDPYEYVYWQYENKPNTVSTTPLERYFGDIQDIDLYKQMNGTNWQDEMFGRTGTSKQHNLAVSGGSKISKYNISITHNDEEEIMIGSGYSRTNLTAKTFYQINKWLSVDMNIRLSDSKIKGAGTSSNSRLMSAVTFKPIKGLADFVDLDLSGDDYTVSASYNLDPVKQTNDDYRRSNTLAFNFNGAVGIKLSKNLNYRLEYGSQYGESTSKRFYGINTSNVTTYGSQPMASIGKTDTKGYRIANTLTFIKRDFFPGHNFSAMVGEELTYSKAEAVTTSSKYFPKYIDAVSALAMMQLGTADPTITSDNPANKLSSFFGRLTYDYKGKYLASATFRADGSSKFAPGNQWGYFPSAALAWRISDEHFMSFTEPWLADLKLRASYGKSGNNRISDNAWKKTFSVSTGGLFAEGDETTNTVFLSPNSILSNPKLKWETTITRNLGVDFGLFKQRITGAVEIYKNTTKDLLMKASIPSITGYTSQWQNIGQTSNKGLEIVLNGNVVKKKDFRLSAQFNIGFNRNRIDKLGETKSWEETSLWLGYTGLGTITGDYLVKEGGQIGQMYGYVTEGMYSFDDFNYENGTYTLKEGIPNNSSLIGSLRFLPGALKLKDQNDDFIVDAANDKVVIGNANPKYTGGFNLTAQIKNFDLSVFFNWVYGNDIYNANKIYFTSKALGYDYRNLLDVMNSNNRFKYVNEATGMIVSNPTELAEMNKNATMWSAGMSTMQLHSWAVEDGSFLRLNTVTVGYSMPKALINRINLSQLRIYVSAYNLWTWTNYSGYDPEVDTARRTPLTPGVDWCAYPRSRSLNVGLNVEF